MKQGVGVSETIYFYMLINSSDRPNYHSKLFSVHPCGKIKLFHFLKELVSILTDCSRKISREIFCLISFFRHFGSLIFFNACRLDGKVEKENINN